MPMYKVTYCEIIQYEIDVQAPFKDAAIQLAIDNHDKAEEGETSTDYYEAEEIQSEG